MAKIWSFSAGLASGIEDHISQNLEMRANLPQKMGSFPAGDVSFPLEMRIPRTRIHISRDRCETPDRNS
jgi:hypothetical protein